MRLAHGGAVRLWGLADTFDPAGAALIAGTAGALLQMHDVFIDAGLHPSSPVIPAAWSAQQVSGNATQPKELVRAIAAGYEATNRLALACSPGQGLAGSASTGTAGSLGAALSAAILLGHDAAGIARAITNAAMLLAASPSITLRTHGELTPLHSGLAARAGLEAALLARDGAAGHHVLEGDGRTPGLIALLPRFDPTPGAAKHWTASAGNFFRPVLRATRRWKRCCDCRLSTPLWSLSSACDFPSA
jgi:2-methylcitrate dehydratase PrpD